jgi:tRNA 2-thiocytidine biosynthesis protein TtcA
MTNLQRQLYRQLKQTCETYELLAPGDHVLVAISGGKDSYSLLVLLGALQSRLPFPVRLTAVHLDQRQPGYDGRSLADWLGSSGFDYEILAEDTYSVVTEHVKPGATYCSLCSRLRRGILYTAAERLGCNKIALGHHRDDALETFLMNLFFAGKLQAMPPKYTTDDGRFQVIRPLLQCAEENIRSFASEQNFPILPCNLCGSQPGLSRDRMTQLLSDLERDSPNLKSVMMAALANVSPTHLLDPDLVAAWHARPTEIRPSQEPRATTQHSAALPLAHGGPAPGLRRSLPVLSDSGELPGE